VARLARAPVALSVPARAPGRHAAPGRPCGATIGLGQRDPVNRNRADAGREGYRQAALAHLTLLLIELARLARDVVADLRRSGEPLLAEVFAVIERRLGEPLSLRDVARELGMTPAHLTTVVRRRTGRAVGEWIIERRMAEARALLAETDLPIAEVARRVGMHDAGYFSRLFGRTHGTSPATGAIGRPRARPIAQGGRCLASRQRRTGPRRRAASHRRGRIVRGYDRRPSLCGLGEDTAAGGVAASASMSKAQGSSGDAAAAGCE